LAHQQTLIEREVKMNIDFNTLSEIASAVDGDTYANYSGRGMYGSTCVGVVVEDSNLLGLGLAIAEIVEDESLRNRLAGGYSTDSLGLRTIVYWQGVTCEDAPEDEDY
jgi:hypothetical protein